MQSIFLTHSQDDIQFNSAKWNKELARAELSDNSDVEIAVMGIASNPHHMLQAQSLSDPEISDLCALFQVSFSLLSNLSSRVTENSPSLWPREHQRRSVRF